MFCRAVFICLLLSGSVISVLCSQNSIAHAQDVGELLFRQPGSGRMLLEADSNLQYDRGEQSLSAIGNVQITYENYGLTADKVTYYYNSGRIIAYGNVEIKEPNGNRIFSEEIDITDNFSDGFISELKVETYANSRFAADSAERIDNNLTILNNGVYTACKICRENPDKPPFWQIRARKVTLDEKKQSISYEKASFELFGKPVAYLPYFSHTSPLVKRKSGFLIPGVVFRQDLGTGINSSYFFNLAPNYDLTLSGTYYTKQGFLGQAEWRHHTQNGAYNLHLAGINQRDRQAFDPNTYDRKKTNRYAFQTSGKFTINPRWTFGWQYLEQSDRNFARTYGITSQTTRDVTNKIHLTGLNGKNYLDAGMQEFLIQEDVITSDQQAQQAQLLPIVDYHYVVDAPVAGGQLSYNFNLAGVNRKNADNTLLSSPATDMTTRFYGIPGKYLRTSADIEWKTNYVTENGVIFTPSLHGRVDSIWLDTKKNGEINNPLSDNRPVYRAIPTAGLEIRYPLIAQGKLAHHIFEPLAQIFISPDETHIGKFPNEDAQSMVFDTTNLFLRNRFSGYDRMESGIRANAGFRYSASFFSGTSLDVVAGQSYHLSGKNSFAERDLVNSGIESGLETKRSDYVASTRLKLDSGLSLHASGRFDERTFDSRRLEAGISLASSKLVANVNYAFIKAQPKYNFPVNRRQISASGSFRIHERWRAFGAITYDTESRDIVSDSIGLAYDDSCLSFSVAYSENNKKFYDSQVNRAITFNLGFRTIGNYSRKISLGK